MRRAVLLIIAAGLIVGCAGLGAVVERRIQGVSARDPREDYTMEWRIEESTITQSLELRECLGRLDMDLETTLLPSGGAGVARMRITLFPERTAAREWKQREEGP